MVSDNSETHFGACPHDCPDACGMLFKTQAGKLVNVRGNPDHPFTRGALCVKLNDFEKHHNNPERLLYPLKRSGPKGSRSFERVSWDEALRIIGENWTRIIEEHGSQAIMPYSYLGNSGVLNGLNVGDAFFNRLGASVTERTSCGSAHIGGYMMTVGPTIGTDPESFVYAKTIVVWACNSVSTNLHHWRYVSDARKKNGARIIVIDCVKSKTAKQADWHIAPKPGTDAALAMGVINALREQDLIDRDYVEKHTVGFEELMARAKEFDLDYVAEVTGVAADDIRQLARELVDNQPSVIRVGIAIERNRQGGQAMRAISCIPALTGAWRHIGGGLLQSPAWAIPMNGAAMSRPEWIPEGARVINSLKLGEALSDSMAIPVKSLVVYNANPGAMAPDGDRIREGLRREDLFTVVSDHFLTDTAAYADIVLPATMAAEHDDIIVSWGHLYIALNQKVIDAPGDTVPNTELFRRLAKTMGFEDEQFQLSDEALMERFIDWDAPQMEGIDLDYLRTHGFARYKVGDAKSWLPHADGNFPTPSGKCEFVSSMASHGNFVAPPYRQMYTKMQDGAPLDPLPGYARSKGASDDAAHDNPFRLRLLTSKSHAFLNSCYANEESKMSNQGRGHILLNPDDADARGIDDGANVRVYNGVGSYSVSAHITEDVPPGLVVTSSGYWRTDERGDVGNANSLCSDQYGDLGRSPTYNDNYVEVALSGD